VAVLNRVVVDETRIREEDGPLWFFDVPAIAAVRADGLDLDARVTVIVGENGTGKSTFVEAVAHAWRSRIKAAVKHWGPPVTAEDSSLNWILGLDADEPLSHGGCFLRAEAMHQLFGSIDGEGIETRAFGGTLNTRSHGESFLAYLESRLSERGLFVLDEPEAALSFTSCLRLLALMGLIADSGSQVLIATHSPLLAAFPGARVLEFTDSGIEQREWQDLDLVTHWQAFLARPDAYLRHLFIPERD
jgi:predicted ATPase